MDRIIINKNGDKKLSPYINKFIWLGKLKLIMLKLPVWPLPPQVIILN
jgi:hypothetical protein